MCVVVVGDSKQVDGDAGPARRSQRHAIAQGRERPAAGQQARRGNRRACCRTASTRSPKPRLVMETRRRAWSSPPLAAVGPRWPSRPWALRTVAAHGRCAHVAKRSLLEQRVDACHDTPPCAEVEELEYKEKCCSVRESNPRFQGENLTSSPLDERSVEQTVGVVTRAKRRSSPQASPRPRTRRVRSSPTTFAPATRCSCPLSYACTNVCPRQDSNLQHRA